MPRLPSRSRHRPWRCNHRASLTASGMPTPEAPPWVRLGRVKVNISTRHQHTHTVEITKPIWIGGKMSDSIQPTKQRKAICALLSLALLLFQYLVLSTPQGSDRRHGTNNDLLIMLFSSICFILAVASIFRREKPAALSWLALALNLAPAILIFLTETLHFKI